MLPALRRDLHRLPAARPCVEIEPATIDMQIGLGLRNVHEGSLLRLLLGHQWRYDAWRAHRRRLRCRPSPLRTRASARSRLADDLGESLEKRNGRNASKGPRRRPAKASLAGGYSRNPARLAARPIRSRLVNANFSETWSRGSSSPR